MLAIVPQTLLFGCETVAGAFAKREFENANNRTNDVAQIARTQLSYKRSDCYVPSCHDAR
jgi:hypothetical protein